ncbi:OmpA family protein [Paracoccus alkanivorans]|nr:OmpA family protein [Paracoccus alkanivorans]
MRRIIHNSTAIAACLSLLAPHLAMAETSLVDGVALERAAKQSKAGQEQAGFDVIAQADTETVLPVEPGTAEQTEAEAEAAAEAEAEAEAEAAAEAETEAAAEAEAAEPVEAETEAAAEAEAAEPVEAETEAPTDSTAATSESTESTDEDALADALAEEEKAAEETGGEAAETGDAAATSESTESTEEDALADALAEEEQATEEAGGEAAETGDAAATSESTESTEEDALADALAEEEQAAEEAGGEAAETGDAAATSESTESTDEDALADALAEEEKAAEEAGEETAETGDAAAASESTESTDEDALADALAEEEKAAEESGGETAETGDAAAASESTESTHEDALAEEGGAETEAAKEAAAATEAPTAAALTAESGEGEVVEQQVTEENSRSSSEDFETSLRDALSGVTGQDGQEQTANADEDDDNNDLAKALLLGAGAVVVGSMLNNNREVTLSTPDRVVVTRADGSQEVIKDEVALLRQPGSTITTENFDDGSSRTVVTRADGSQVVTIRDADLRVLRRTLVSADGSSTQLIDDTAGVEPVDIASLPAPAEPVETGEGPLDEEELRAALLRETDIDRRFTLGQIRNIAEVRALVAPVNIDAITFETGSAAIKSDQAKQLSALGNVIQGAISENPREIFLIEGHTDTVGDAAMNLALSDRRAESVALALSEYFDVPPENLVVQGYGEQFLQVRAEGDIRENRRASVRRITDLLQTSE